MEFIFFMQINVKDATNWDYCFFMEVARHVQITENRELVLFFAIS